MPARSVPFIGRQAELDRVTHCLHQSQTVSILYIDGPGGIGKSRLLAEIARLPRAFPALITTDIVDFDILRFRVPGNIRLELARQLGEEHFQTFLAQVRTAFQQSAASLEQREQEELAFHTTFQTDYATLAGQYRIVVLLDTVEVAAQTETWTEVVQIMQQAQNSLFVLAGRNAAALYDQLRPTLPHAQHTVMCLGPLTQEETGNYIQHKEKLLHLTPWPADLRSRLALVAHGKPILIDLAIEWLARDIPLDWLQAHPLEALTQLAEHEQRELEAALVQPLVTYTTELNRIILYLAYAYPIDEQTMLEVFGIDPDDLPSLVQELRILSSVKALADGSYALHDEVRRMINEYIWKEIDPDARRRQQISRRMANYCNEQANALAAQLAPTVLGTSPVRDEGLQRLTNQQRYGVLREQQLYHQLQADKGAGLALFMQLFDAAGRGEQMQRGPLLKLISTYVDQFDPDQQYEISIRRIRYWLDTKRVEHVQQAKQALETLLSQYADGAEREVDMLTRLANADRQLGAITEATHRLERALNICLERVPHLLSTIQNTLGWYYRILGNLDKARNAYQVALEYAQNETTIASIFNNLGFVECLRGEYTAARRYCEHACAIRTRLGRQWELGVSYATLADIYRFEGRYDDAITFATRAIEIFEALPERDLEWLAQVYARRGATQRVRATNDDERKAAVADLEKSLEQDYPPQQPYALHVMGCIYRDQGDLDQALEWFQQSDARDARHLDVWSHISNLIGTAEIYYQKWLRDPQPAYVAHILASGEQLRQVKDHGYLPTHHDGRMHRVLGNLAYSEGRLPAALSHYAEAYILLSERYGGYDRQTLHDELDALSTKIDQLPPQQIITWCDYLQQVWSDPQRSIRNRQDLLSLCRIHRKEAQMRLAQTDHASS